MNRISKLTARIEALRAEESTIKARHAEALVAQADDDFGDIDSRAIKRLQVIRVEIEGLEDALEKAAALDEADVAAAADQKRLAEFRAFEDSLQPRLAAVQGFEKALQVLVDSIRAVQAADAGMPGSLRRETPWRFAVTHALGTVLGRGEELPQSGTAPQPVGFWNRDEAAPCSSFILREHQHRAYHEAVELNRAALLDDEPTMPEHMRESIEPKPEATASRPEIFVGTFVEQGDGFFIREGDGRVFEKTEFGFIVAAGHPGYNNRRTMVSREIG